MEPRKVAPIVVAIIAAFCIIVGAKALFFKSAPVMQLPQGEQQVVGILKPVELSPTRRGTHVLEVDGKALTFVEAAKSLKTFEGLRVTVTGTFEENIDPSLLPVLIAADVRPKALALTEWTLDELGVSVSVPDEWSAQREGSGLRAQPADAASPILRVLKADTDTLPPGESVVVGGTKAARVMNGDGETVYARGKDGAIVAFDFQPYATEDVGVSEQRYAFRQVVLHSVKIGSSATSSSAASGGTTVTGSGTATLGMPCGGEAGILCPAGQYCEVTDAVTNIGRCKAF